MVIETTSRPQKITFGEMREMGVRDVLIYCRDHHCSHVIAISAEQWADVRLSDIESQFVCAAPPAASAVPMCGRTSHQHRWASGKCRGLPALTIQSRC